MAVAWNSLICICLGSQHASSFHGWIAFNFSPLSLHFWCAIFPECVLQWTHLHLIYGLSYTLYYLSFVWIFMSILFLLAHQLSYALDILWESAFTLCNSRFERGKKKKTEKTSRLIKRRRVAASPSLIRIAHVMMVRIYDMISFLSLSFFVLCFTTRPASFGRELGRNDSM